MSKLSLPWSSLGLCPLVLSLVALGSPLVSVPVLSLFYLLHPSTPLQHMAVLNLSHFSRCPFSFVQTTPMRHAEGTEMMLSYAQGHAFLINMYSIS